MLPSPMRSIARLLPTAACALAASCAWLADEPPPVNPNAPRLVGRIAAIPPDRQFVLIESYGPWNVAAGTTLTVHGPEGRSANLIATGETLRHHAAADVQSGTLAIGDGVYLQPTAKNAPKDDDPGAESAPKPVSGTVREDNVKGSN
jgi:hypothetical protein